MTSRYFGCFQFIDVSTSTKNKFSNSQKRVTSLKCPFSPFFMETFVIFTQNSASPVPDHTPTQRSGAQITLPLRTDQPGSHENSEFRRLSLSVIYGIIEVFIVLYKSVHFKVLILIILNDAEIHDKLLIFI